MMSRDRATGQDSAESILLTTECDLLRQSDESQVIGEVTGVPLRMCPAIIGGDLQSVRLRDPVIVGSYHDLKLSCT